MVKIVGHCLIKDEFDNVYLDKENHVHPGNMARMIARMLSGESNHWVNSIAFGYGATIKNHYGDREFLPANDGIAPDLDGWESRLYSETYRKYIDDVSVPADGGYGVDTLDTSLDLLHADGVPKYHRTHRNVEGVISYVDENGKSKVEITCILDVNKNLTFDEIALFSGITKSEFSGEQTVNFSDITTTGLTINTDYTFSFRLNGNPFAIKINVPDTKFETLLLQLNDKLEQYGCSVTLKNKTIIFSSKFATIEIDDIFVSQLLNYVSLDTPIDIYNEDNYIADTNRFDKNNPIYPEFEAPRLLTHLIFDPIDKPALSNFYITYTLTIEVEPTIKRDHDDFTIPNEYRLDNIFEYNATNKSDTWSIFHQLGYVPKVQVFVDNKILREKIDYTWVTGTTLNAAENQIIIKFKAPQKGTARLF